MKKIKKGVVLIILIVVCLGSVNIYAKSLTEKIEVIFNSINIKINDKSMVTNNILYKGTTYVPIRSAAEMLGMKVDWVPETKTANITDASNVSNNESGLLMLNISPEENGKDGYLKWGYISILFNKSMMGSKNIKEIYLADEHGERNEIKKVNVGITSKETILVIPDTDLKLNTNYNLYIPKNNLINKSEKFYNKDIILHFKTASNVIKGKINSDKEYHLKEIKLENNSNEYTTTVVNKNEFFFKNIEEGQYYIYMINEGGIKQFEYNIIVKANEINDVIIYDYLEDK